MKETWEIRYKDPNHEYYVDHRDVGWDPRDRKTFSNENDAHMWLVDNLDKYIEVEYTYTKSYN